MSDNLTTQDADLATIPTGTVIATDDVAGTHFQRVKLVDGTLDSTAATGVAASPLRVDPTGTTAQPVTDNAGSLTVDSTQLPAVLGAGGGVKVDGSGTALPVSGTVTANAGAGPFPVSDNAGSLTVDAPVATPVAARLSDGAAFYDATKTGQLPAALVGGRLSVDASGVAVPVTDNAGSLTVDAPVGTPVFARLSDGAAALVGQKTMANSLPVALASDQSAVAIQDNASLVDNAGFTDGTSRVVAVGYIFDEVAGTALTENDIAAGRVDAKRAQATVLEDATTRGQRAAISAAGAQKAEGGAASGVAVAGNPFQQGGRAATANPGAVTDGQAAYQMLDKLGKSVITPLAPRTLTSQNTITLTTTGETSLIAAGAAGVFHDLTTIIIVNTSATGVRVDFRDALAGTIRFAIWAPPTSSTTHAFFSPIEATGAAAAWTAQLSAAVTDVRIFAKAVKNL